MQCVHSCASFSTSGFKPQDRLALIHLFRRQCSSSVIQRFSSLQFLRNLQQHTWLLRKQVVLIAPGSQSAQMKLKRNCNSQPNITSLSRIILFTASSQGTHIHFVASEVLTAVAMKGLYQLGRKGLQSVECQSTFRRNISPCLQDWSCLFSILKSWH